MKLTVATSQISGAPPPTLASPSPQSWTQAKTLKCEQQLTHTHQYELTGLSISGTMTTALIGYSAVFMRYAFAVTPRNYLLFGCHAINFSAQTYQGYRFVNYWHMGGVEAKAEKAAEGAEGSVVKLAKDAKAEVQKGIEKVKGQ